MAQLLPLADPERFAQPAPQPSPELGPRIAAAIGGERRGERRRRRRFGLALGGATAAAAVLALVVLPGGDGGGNPEQHVEFAALPPGIKIGATLEPHAFGTEIRVYVKGVRSGTLCRVFLRGPHGERVSAGSFRYRWGDDSTATLSPHSTSPAPGRSASAPATAPSSPRSTRPGRPHSTTQTRRT